MIKKFLSVLLAVMMVVSVMAVGAVTSNAATTEGFTPEATKIYFDIEGAVDANGTTWKELMTNNKGVLAGKIAFYMAGGDFDTETNPTKPLAWGGKKLIGTATANEVGIYEIDPVAKLGYQLTEGVQYKLIFVRVDGANWKEQTCDLFFTTDCLGHVAKCDGTMMENNVDSSKKSLAVYWDDSIDPAENGPVLCITSIGNVVGSCVEQGKTKYDLFVEFLSDPKEDFQDKTCYENAHKYKCEIDPSSSGYKSEQQLIDDIGEGLGLTKDDIKAAFEEQVVTDYFTAADISCSWSYDDSTLPSGQAAHTHTPGEPVIENDTPSTCTVQGSYDEVVYCTECKEEISRETKYHELAQHTAGDPVIENDHTSTCTVQGAYDEVVYCTVCKGEISRETKYHELAQHTAGEPVQDMMAGYPATCTENGLKVMVTRCTECGTELNRQEVIIYAEGHKLHFVPEVPATATKDGVKAHYACENCDKLFSDAQGSVEVTAESLVIPAQFVRGDVNNDGEFDALDVTTLQRVMVELDVETYNPVAADVDLDGEVDMIDVTLMQRVLAQMTTWEAWDAKHLPS